MKKRKNVICLVLCLIVFMSIGIGIITIAVTSGVADRDEQGTVSCPHYSLQLPLTKYYIQNDGSGYFLENDYIVGGVNRLEKGLTAQMDASGWATSEPESLLILLPEGETAVGDIQSMERGLNAFHVDTTDGQGVGIDHVFVIVGGNLIFDFWVYRDAFTEEEITIFESSIVLGGKWSRCPDSNRFITLYQPGSDREGTYQPNIGSSYCYLWEEMEDGITLLEAIPTGFGGLSAGTARDPIWSPDGQRLVITVESLDLTIFYFPLERFQVEVPFPKNQRDLQIPFYMSNWKFDYKLADVPRAVFLPIRWSEDSTRLLFHYAWTDSQGIRRSGNAWFVLNAEANKQLLPA